MLRAAIVALAVTACAGPDVRVARQARYDAERAAVFDAVLTIVKRKFENLSANADDAMIKTAWFQVDTTEPQHGGRRDLRPRYFERYDIRLDGGRPWRVEVAGYASMWKHGDTLPVPLTGAAEPGWLKSRTEALEVAIYEHVSTVVPTKRVDVDMPSKRAETAP